MFASTIRLVWSAKNVCNRHNKQKKFSVEVYCQYFSYFSLETFEHAHLIGYHAKGDSCRLLITFANSLAPDQDRQNVGPDLDLNCLTL